jgi:cholesterol transport system auxiliary component
MTALSLLFVCGCSALKPADAPRPHFFTLDGVFGVPAAAPKVAAGGTTLIVTPPRAAAGFDSQRIIYMRQPHALDHYAYNEWTDTPARMLAPLIVRALERSGAFRAVVQTPSTAAGDIRLDTEVMRLQHEFLEMPSRVRFTLRATLVDNASRRVLASREFEAVADAPSENPYGGVMAATEAVRTVLEHLSAFCADAARGVQAGPPSGRPPR